MPYFIIRLAGPLVGIAELRLSFNQLEVLRNGLCCWISARIESEQMRAIRWCGIILAAAHHMGLGFCWSVVSFVAMVPRRSYAALDRRSPALGNMYMATFTQVYQRFLSTRLTSTLDVQSLLSFGLPTVLWAPFQLRFEEDPVTLILQYKLLPAINGQIARAYVCLYAFGQKKKNNKK